MREVLRTRYLTRQRRTVASVYREITRECKVRGLQVPSRGTVLRRIARLDPVKTVSAREGRDAARSQRSAGGTPPEIAGLLEQVRVDHTPVDVIVVDERDRLPVGRPYLTMAIDVASRCVVGLVVTLEAPSATSVGLCLAHAAADKRPWLERLEAEAAWSMSGKPRELYVDDAAEFKSEALRRGCEQHGIRQRYRPPGQPHFGGIVERLIGTMMQMVHELPGTTFSSIADRGSYDSGATAALTLRELQRWLALAVACYHGEVHESLGRTPGGGLGGEGRRVRDARDGGQRDRVPGRLPPGDPADAVALGVRDRPRAVLLRRAEAVDRAPRAAGPVHPAPRSPRHQPYLGARPRWGRLPGGAVPDPVAAADQRVGANGRSCAAAVASFCKWAVRHELLDASPMDRIDAIEVPRTLPRPAAAADVAAVLDAICSRRPRKDVPVGVLRDRVLFETAYVCGARASEVCSAPASTAGRGPLSYDAAHNRWKKYCAVAGAGIGIHQLRHAHATEQLSERSCIGCIIRRIW
jgi:transposase InsO family protein